MPGEADAALRIEQPQQREAQSRLARSALSDNPQGRAGAHRHRHAVDRFDIAFDPAEQAAADREPHLYLLALHDDRGRRIGGRHPAFRLGREQAARIRVLRPREYLAGRPGLDDLALGHHADPLGHVAHNREIVRDQQQRHAEPVLQLAHQMEDLRLNGDIERRRRFVGDQDVGLVGDCHRDHDPLPLSAGELVRIGAEPVLGVANTDQAQQFERARARRRRRHVLVDQQYLGDLLIERVQRVQRGHRLLEDHRDPVAAHLPQPRRRRPDHLLAVEADAALRRVRGGRVGEQLQDGQRRDRLARAAFADQGQRLAAVQCERDTLDGLDRVGAAPAAERDAQVVDFEQAHRFGDQSPGPPAGGRRS